LLPAGFARGFGGGVCVASGTVTLSNSTLADNSANTADLPVGDLGGQGYGGGLCNGGFDMATGGTVTLTNLPPRGHSAAGDGGGLFNDAGGTATLTNCTINGNSAAKDGGGGLAIDGLATLTNCSISDNSVAPTQSNFVGGGGLRGHRGISSSSFVY